jgi:hypothetical protein
VTSIKDAMQRLLESPSLRQSLGQRGLTRAAQFNYRLAAKQTIRVYENL